MIRSLIWHSNSNCSNRRYWGYVFKQFSFLFCDTNDSNENSVIIPYIDKFFTHIVFGYVIILQIAQLSEIKVTFLRNFHFFLRNNQTNCRFHLFRWLTQVYLSFRFSRRVNLLHNWHGGWLIDPPSQMSRPHFRSRIKIDYSLCIFKRIS